MRDGTHLGLQHRRRVGRELHLPRRLSQGGRRVAGRVRRVRAGPQLRLVELRVRPRGRRRAGGDSQQPDPLPVAPVATAKLLGERVRAPLGAGVRLEARAPRLHRRRPGHGRPRDLPRPAHRRALLQVPVGPARALRRRLRRVRQGARRRAARGRPPARVHRPVRHASALQSCGRHRAPLADRLRRRARAALRVCAGRLVPLPAQGGVRLALLRHDAVRQDGGLQLRAAPPELPRLRGPARRAAHQAAHARLPPCPLRRHLLRRPVRAAAQARARRQRAERQLLGGAGAAGRAAALPHRPLQHLGPHRAHLLHVDRARHLHRLQLLRGGRRRLLLRLVRGRRVLEGGARPDGGRRRGLHRPLHRRHARLLRCRLAPV
mmetsp:Transcript_8976/g.28374  ORF Transcript_8976/g.28374 Transcript_8976/m.28374 type:complete len:377 (-) Transcript_8976:1332-2462(-)